MRNFSDFVDTYVRYCQGQETPAKVHRWTAYSIIAGALGRKVWINRGYYTLFPNLYVFVIGPSGLLKKSTSTGIGVDLLRSLPDFRLMSERLTAASLIMQLSRAHSFFGASEGRKQQSAVFAYASELSVFLGEVFGSTSELLTTFYDCSPHDCDKPWIYENKAEGQVKIFGPCLNILGASTPAWLIRCIPSSEMEGGFSSRVIFVVHNEPPTKFVAFPEVTPESRELKPKLLADLTTIHKLIGQAEIDPAGREFFSVWYERHQRSLASNSDARFNGYFGRKPDTVLKLALVLSVSESSDLIVTKAHLEKALRELDLVETSMFDAFGSHGKYELSEELNKVWTLIRTRGEITHAEIIRTNWRDFGHKRLVEIVEDLRRMGVVRVSIAGDTLLYSHVRVHTSIVAKAPGAPEANYGSQ